MRLWCAVPTCEKFIVQLLYVRPALHRTCLCHEVGVFRKECVSFAEYFTGKGASHTNQCWCQKPRVIALCCGIKISAVHHVVPSQYTHLTDGRTKLRQQYRALHYMVMSVCLPVRLSNACIVTKRNNSL